MTDKLFCIASQNQKNFTAVACKDGGMLPQRPGVLPTSNCAYSVPFSRYLYQPQPPPTAEATVPFVLAEQKRLSILLTKASARSELNLLLDIKPSLYSYWYRLTFRTVSIRIYRVYLPCSLALYAFLSPCPNILPKHSFFSTTPRVLSRS